MNAVKLGNKVRGVSTSPRYRNVRDSEAEPTIKLHICKQREQTIKDDKEDKKSNLRQATPYKAKPHVAAVHDDATDSSVEKQRSRSEQARTSLSATNVIEFRPRAENSETLQSSTGRELENDGVHTRRASTGRMMQSSLKPRAEDKSQVEDISDRSMESETTPQNDNSAKSRAEMKTRDRKQKSYGNSSAFSVASQPRGMSELSVDDIRFRLQLQPYARTKQGNENAEPRSEQEEVIHVESQAEQSDEEKGTRNRISGELAEYSGSSLLGCFPPPVKTGALKMLDVKMMDQLAGHENAGMK